MISSSIGKHAGSGPASDQPAVLEPAFGERARTLMYVGRIGSLSTLSRRQSGFPFGSVMPYGLDDHGRPIFLISTMAMHTQNLQADPRASLLVTRDDTDGDPLGASRVTLVGNVLPIPPSEVAEARQLYLARYANSRYWVDFEDFSFYRMDVVDVYYVGGFGVMGWVTASEYDRSQPDPLADSMAEIIQHMNADHKDALVLITRKFAHIESQEATMTAVDRLGFHVRVKTPDGMRGARVAFLRVVSNPAETRKVLVEMVQQARSQGEGFSTSAPPDHLGAQPRDFVRPRGSRCGPDTERYQGWRPGTTGMILTFGDELLTNTVSTPFPTGIASIFTARQLCLGVGNGKACSSSPDSRAQEPPACAPPEWHAAAYRSWSKPCLKAPSWARASSSTWSPTPLAWTKDIHAGLASSIASRNAWTTTTSSFAHSLRKSRPMRKAGANP